MRLITPTSLFLAAVATAQDIKCHYDSDAIGGQCVYANIEVWNKAAYTYCNQAAGTKVPEGESRGFYMDNQDNGYNDGKPNRFWGNYRNDRGGDLTIMRDECIGYMGQLWGACPGYGGWVNTGFGTVSSSTSK
ncbi:hypothetical protein PRZ48_012096 [Zasmidium cellare]|uniref:Uncharacterized protein n=1 Tax=Zasmidium cellare TaxID=395010 RepID=A0ABR0E3Z0_ZASCE|nr:hypothetical protein PRZ48_012096 [Zasmidium cellare]